MRGLVQASSYQSLMSDHRLVRDSAGRDVQVPKHARRVLPTGNPAAAAIFCVARDRLLGWPEPIPGQAPPITAPLPTVPRLTPYDFEKSARAVRRAAPDLILDYGNCAAGFVDFANRLQAETGVPVAIVDGHLSKTNEALTLLCQIFDAAPRAEKLAAEWQRVWANVRDACARSDPAPKVHYAIGPAGDKTVRRGSIHLESIDLLGAENVAEVEAGNGGRVKVDPRDVAAWNPDMILTIDPAFHDRAATLDVWGDMAAVKHRRLYLAPAPILSWFDYPPSMNRIIGLAWLARLFHRDAYRGDLLVEAQRFHRVFYCADLNPQMLATALAKAGVG